MVYKSCPQCGKSNHHNKVKCAECGVCLRAGKAGRPKVKGDQKQRGPLVGRPCMPLNVQCPSCGHRNDLRRVSKCPICDKSLVGKGGRPEVKSSIHLNEARRTSCSECECALIGKRRWPEMKLTIPCPSCHKLNCSDHVRCSSCQEILCVIIVIRIVYNPIILQVQYVLGVNH